MKPLFSLRKMSASLSLAASLLAISGLLTGCSNNFDPMAGTTPPETSLGKITGSVYGGRTPVVGASVYVYQTGTTGYGSASTSLLTSYPNGSSAGGYPTVADGNGNYYVTSGNYGQFAITGDYSCKSGSQVYIYTVGGNAGSGTNTAAGFLAALGQCPASGSFANSLVVTVNEASTIAAAYALAGFSVDALHIGIPTSTTSALATLEQTNLNNAFLTAANIFPISTPATNSSFPATTAGTTGSVNAITAYSITSGVATFTCTNNFAAGTSIALSGFPTSTFLNGQTVTVLAAGLSGTQFEATVTGSTANVTKYTIASNVVTFSATNSFYVGESLTLSGFSSSLPAGGTAFNGQTVTTITGGSGTKFLVNYTATNTSGSVTTTGAVATIGTGTVTESGVASVLPLGLLPTAKLNSLANSLAACINSAGPSSTPCTDVLGTATDTASAAISIAQNPATNVSTIFNAASGTAIPYNPTLSAAPADWTLSIIYSGGGLSMGTAYVEPKMVAIDASGNVWTVSLTSPWTLSGFTNQGVPLSSTGYTNANQAYIGGVIVDAASQNLFINDEINAGDTAYSTYIQEFNIANSSYSTITPMNGSATVLDDPADMAFDASGNLWIVNSQTNTLVELAASTYSYVASATNTTYVANDYYDLAVEPGTGGVWVGGYTSSSTKKYLALFTNADVFSTDGTTDYDETTSISIDASGNAWSAGYEAGIAKVPAAGGTGSTYAYPTEYSTVEVDSSAIDGGGNVWIADMNNGYLYEYNNSGTLISGKYGYQPNEGTITPFIPPNAPSTGYVKPAYMAIDGSGNVWSKPSNSATIQEMVGVAVPVVTPIAYGTANNLLGQEP